MLVTVVEVVGTQRRVEMVDQGDVGRVVQRGALGNHAGVAQQALCGLVTLVGQEHLVALLVHGEVAGLGHAFAGARVGLAFLAHQVGNDLVHGHVHGRVVFGLAADDQRRAGLIDQDGVHLVNDGVVEHALNAVARLVDHVVAQVVEAVLVVRAVGDVAVVGGLLFLARHVGQVDAHRQSEEVVQLGHPGRIAIGQIVVHGHHVHAIARQCVQVDRQRGGQRLAFAGAHFGDLAVVQRHAAQQLNVEVAHLHDALGALAHHGEGFGQQVVQRLALGHTFLELLRLCTQSLVAELLVVGLHRIDANNRLAVLLEKPIVSAAE